MPAAPIWMPVSAASATPAITSSIAPRVAIYHSACGRQGATETEEHAIPVRLAQPDRLSEPFPKRGRVVTLAVPSHEGLEVERGRQVVRIAEPARERDPVLRVCERGVRAAQMPEIHTGNAPGRDTLLHAGRAQGSGVLPQLIERDRLLRGGLRELQPALEMRNDPEVLVTHGRRR